MINAPTKANTWRKYLFGTPKGLHAANKAVEYTALAKGIYETGQTLFSIGRTVAPMAASLL